MSMLHGMLRGLLLLCATHMPLAMAQSADDLMMRMNHAFTHLSYDGVFSYLYGGDLVSLRVVHKVVDGVQRERLVHLNGAPREILRHGEEVSCLVMPGDDLIALENSIPSGPFARAFVREFDRIADTYAVVESGEGRVAGRPAIRVAVSPKDEHRYGYRLWLDRETALLLRSELVDHEGNKLEIFMFNQVLFGDAVSDAALEPEETTGAMVSHLTLQATREPPRPAPSANETDPAVSAWSTTWLPAGFNMATADLHRKRVSGQDVSSLMYTDGLAAFSIFVEPMPERGAASMISRNGATVAVTHKVDGAKGYYLVTLVGEIPLHTAQAIVNSVYQK